ncbi:MAG TPA: hypothetical protein VF881_15985 [Polyangiaceae bacterium]
MAGRIGSTWTAVGAAALAMCMTSATRLGAAPSKPQPARGTFNLAVERVQATQVGSTSMFREIEIHCIVRNQGPRVSSAPATILISRPGDDGPKILKRANLPSSLPRDELFEVVAQSSVWFATPVAYRCEIRFEGAADADPSDNAGETVFPQL